MLISLIYTHAQRVKGLLIKHAPFKTRPVAQGDNNSHHYRLAPELMLLSACFICHVHVYIGALSNRVRLKCRHLMWENRASDSFRALLLLRSCIFFSLGVSSACVYNLDTGSAPGEINFERRAAWSYKATQPEHKAGDWLRDLFACMGPNYLPMGAPGEDFFRLMPNLCGKVLFSINWCN